VEYLDEFLPKKLDEATTRALVQRIVTETGATTTRDLGRIMGAVMKSHRDEVDAGLVRSIAESLLTD
jgi:uncharacterized protein YqeY